MQQQPVDIQEVTDNDLANLIHYRCSGVEAASLVRPIQGDEIKAVLFSMPANKAPGPYEFPMEFYKVAWPIVERDFITAVQSIFFRGFLPRSINVTLLYLVPKTLDPGKYQIIDQ